jgi:nicotinamide riboside kinase
MAASDESHRMKIALPAMKIALLGAESTGKTQLAHELAAHLQSQGQTAIAIDEYLREWCEQHARTPHQDEQHHIAHTQQACIEAAAQQATWVFADTTPLMTAVYSEFIFQDTSLTPAALAYQTTFDLTLITGLDMPWQADGIQRDGEHVRAPVDTLLRQHLQTAGMTFEVIYGTGEHRTTNALQAIARQSQFLSTTNSVAHRADNTSANDLNDLKRWQSRCEKCSDSDCEHRLFSRLK